MVYGYFASPLSEAPDYDPGLEVECPVCYCRLSHPVKTISVMAEGDSKSYFYRTHKSCYDNLTPENETELDSFIIDTISRTKYLN
ncbi:hypothetical protein ANRL1_02870 [Anaerolineae bacterium]|nr:hypothetical protein ANRL1_02870 [Anaerolineae bacterium]